MRVCECACILLCTLFSNNYKIVHLSEHLTSVVAPGAHFYLPVLIGKTCLCTFIVAILG